MELKEEYKKASESESQAKRLRDEKRFDEAAAKFKEAARSWKKLQNERNYLWCMANHYYFEGHRLSNAERYEEAHSQFKRSRHFFGKLGILKQVKFCEAHMHATRAEIERINNNFADSAKLYFKAAQLLKDVSRVLCLNYECQAYLILGFGEMKNERYDKAKNYFRLAEETAEVLKDNQTAYWARAHACECEYYKAKYERNLKRIIKVLEDIVKNYAKTRDRTALFVSKGDLAKYRGLWLKIEKKFLDATQCFHDSISWHRQALTSDPRYSDKHQLSVHYSSALAVGTEADIDLLVRNKFSDASIKYGEASQKFADCGDMKSASIYYNLSQLSIFLANDNFEEALSFLRKLSLDFRLPSKPMSVKEFLSHTGLMISSYAAKMVKEIVEIEKGPSFEARVRELIKSFDNSEVNGREIQVLPDSIRKLKLNQYKKVERKIFRPRNDEIGIVFRNDTPVELDVLAERTQGNRRLLLLAECKHSPGKVFRTRELALLKRKAEFVKVRYEKLADLCEEHKPIIEQEWFITTGNFGNDAIEFARINNLTLVGIVALNKLLKRFALPRIRE